MSTNQKTVGITIQDEVFEKCSGKKSAPLTQHEIEVVIAVTCAPSWDLEVFNALRRPWRKESILPDEPVSTLEYWLSLYRKHPDAVLYVMQVCRNYMKGRSPIKRELAVRSYAKKKKKTIREIARDLRRGPGTVTKARQRLNADARNAQRARARAIPKAPKGAVEVTITHDASRASSAG